MEDSFWHRLFVRYFIAPANLKLAD